MLFNAPMVRAILDGSKTQTRRVWTLPKWAEWDLMEGGEEKGVLIPKDPKLRGWYSVDDVACPFGQVGDHLWVRETFSMHPQFGQIAYRADGEEYEDADGFAWYPKWKPSIHMPRSASRIQLEITGVRVERLQDISREDAAAEGMCYLAKTEYSGMINGGQLDGTKAIQRHRYPEQNFGTFWESLGGPGSWDANPWVWVIEFKVVKP